MTPLKLYTIEGLAILCFLSMTLTLAETKEETYKDVDTLQYRPMIKYLSKLQIFAWEVFPDMAIFDWFIKLSDKERQALHFYFTLNFYQVLNLFFNIF